MKTKQFLPILGLMVLGLTMMMMGGCGTSYYDETSYEYPNWTPEGLIYCQKAVTHYRKEPMGTITLGTDYSYVTMDTDGDNEAILPYSSYPYFSPKGTYAALISDETISIYKRADNSKVYEFSPTTESISSLDWGPDEARLVYLKNRGGINVINIDGTGNLNIATSGEAVTWKYGTKIVFEYLDGLYTPTAIINIDGTGRTNLGDQSISSATVSSIATNEIYGSAGNEYGYIDVNVATPQFHAKISNFRGYLPKINPGANKIVYGQFRSNGVWLINIDGSNIKQLK
ncbi:MAG: hypothetical protein ABIH50_02115 [bacterium]